MPHPPRARTVLRTGWSILALLTAVSVGRAQTEPVETIVDTVDVQLVNIEVVVTRDGRPVHGLTRDDFRVFDDGEAVAITHFTAAEVNAVELDAAGGDRPADPAATETARTAIGRRSAPASLVILVDTTFLTPTHRRRLTLALAEHLDALLADGAQVMVVAKEGEVRIEQSFTRDRSAVDAALERVVASRRAAGFVETQRSVLLRSIELGESPGSEAGEGAARDLFSRVTGYAEAVRKEVERSSETLRALLQALSGVPGRKALIYLADQLPLHPGDDVFAAWLSKYGGFARATGILSLQDWSIEHDTTTELLELAADAAASRVAFYPLGGDTAAGRSFGAARAARAGAASFGGGPSPERGLRLLARATGGDAAFGIANVGGLTEGLLRDVTSYYALGYPSPHAGDDRRHRVKVEVAGAGLEVRYLDTYRARSVDQQLIDLTLASLFFENSSNPLDVRLRLGELEPRSGFVLVPVEVLFPVARLTLVPREGHHVGNVSIVVVARDAEGRLTDPARIRVPVRIPDEQMPLPERQVAGYVAKLAMKAGEQTVAVGVRDDVGGVSSTTRLRLAARKAGSIP